MKQTAVEWLVDELLDGKLLMPSLIEQAKEIEKQQIINAHTNGQAEYDTGAFRPNVIEYAEQYYNEEYGNET